ncbi:hypothetical protein PS6_010324 [Mucor atramentarius]
MTKLKTGNAKEKNRPASIDTTAIATTAETWPHLDVLNQIMTPVQLLNDNALQQELDFYTRAQFKFTDEASTPTATTATSTATTPVVTATTRNASYFDSLNIPSDQHQEYNTNRYSNNHSYASLLFNSQQPQQQQPAHSTDGSLLLAHEPVPYKQQNALQSLYSNNSTPANSTPNSPIVNFDTNHQQQHYLEDSDRFAAMFLSSSSASTASPLTNIPNEPLTSKGKKNATPQKFRFKQDNKQQQQQQQPLDSKLLSRHNLEQDKKSGIKRPLKNKQKASTSARRKPPNSNQQLDSDHDSQQDDDSQDDDGEDRDEDAPVIGDGAQSYSSMGSNSSRTSQPLTKDDKRRRNTAASARFRIKKKMREQALQNTACEMTDKAQRMEQRVHELEREIKWLKALVVEKNEARIEQLVRERPPNSIAFPSSHNNHHAVAASSSASTSATPSSSSSSTRHKNQIMMMTPNHDQEDMDQQDEDRTGKGRHYGGQRRRF